MQKVLALCLFIFGTSFIRGEDCVWNKDTEFPAIPPLLIDLNTWLTLKPVNENGTRIIRIAENTTLVVACTGSTITTLGVEVAEGSCAGGQFLNIAGTNYTALSLGCTSSLDDSVLNTTAPCGDQGIGTALDIGFDVVGYMFYPVFSVCFEPINEITLYAVDIIYGNNIDAEDPNPSQPSMKTDSTYYPLINPNECYLTANQDLYFTNLTGNPNFTDLDSDHYFARGHLAPNGDFLIDDEADASYYYLNAVPHWQIYNAATSNSLDSNVRDLALLHRSDLVAYTGPWQNLVLNDVDGNPTVIYLCSSQDLSIIPVSQLIWKVISEPSTNRGLAVITSNYPYEQTPPTPICPDIGCDTISWITFNTTDVSNGYTYCCTVQDFSLANPNAPDLGDATVLTD